MKTANALLLAMGLASGFSVQAHTENQDLCYPLAHGENGLGSTNSKHTPLLFANGSNPRSYIYVTNVSYEWINVKFKFWDVKGEKIAPSEVANFGTFTKLNSPVDIGNGGAILRPKQSGWIKITGNHGNGFISEMVWQADSCLDAAVVVSIKNERITSSTHDYGIITINGGNPF